MNNGNIKFLILFLTVMLTFINVGSARAQGGEEFEPTGTFSSLRVDDDPDGPGDLSGYEIVVKKTDSGYKGTYRYAEGGIPDFIPITPVIDGEMISFTYEERGYARGKKYIDKFKFIGFYDDKGISGTVMNDRGGITDKLNLWRLPHEGIWTGPGRLRKKK